MIDSELEKLLYISEEDYLASQLQDHLSDVRSESEEYAVTVIISKDSTIKWNFEPANQQGMLSMENIIGTKPSISLLQERKFQPRSKSAADMVRTVQASTRIVRSKETIVYY